MQDKIKNNLLKQQDSDLLASLKNLVIIALTDNKGKLIYANEKFSDLLGVTKENTLGRCNHLLKSHVPNRASYVEIWSTLQAGEAWKGVLPHKTNTKKYWLETTIKPLKNNQGDVVKYLTLCNDISNYYSHPVYSKEKHLIGNFANETIYINKCGKIINTSRSVFNSSNDSFVGCFIYDFVNPSDQEYLRKEVKRVFDTGETSKYKSIGLCPKEKETTFITKIKPVVNLHDEIIYATISSKKLKAKVKAKDELKAMELKYSNIFQSINVGIIVVANSSGDIIEWNKGAELAFGYTETQIIGEPLTVLISKKHVATGVKELLKAVENLDNNMYGENIEMLGLKKNGQEFPVEFTISHWKNGEEDFYCAIMLDISKRKKLEEKLKTTTKDLELFLYRAAHDLKAPLTSAEGLLNLLKEEKMNDRSTQVIDMLDETLEKSRSLLDDLAFASIVSEKKRAISIIDFETEISKVLTQLKGTENFDNIVFETDIQQTTDFHFNQELIKFVFQNLIQNAIIYSRPITDNHIPKIQIEVKALDANTHIIITDNGQGIGQEHIDKIFNLYYKISSRNPQSTGLGLFVIKRIVEDLNGDILVKSELNQGTSFEVILPNLF